MLNELYLFNKPTKGAIINDYDVNNDYEYQQYFKHAVNSNDFDPYYYIDGYEPPPINDILHNHPAFFDLNIEDDTTMDIPVETIPLDIIQPINQTVISAADTCSNINGISLKTALKFNNKIITLDNPQPINTGNGIFNAHRFMRIKLKQIPCKTFLFYVIDSLPYDYLVGRSILTALNYKLIKVQYHNYFVHKPEMIEDDECNNYPNQPDMNNLLQCSDYDKNEIKIGHKHNPKVEPFIESLLNCHQSSIAGHEFDSGIIKDYLFRIPLTDENAIPVTSKEYPIPIAARKELSRQFKQLRKYGFIRDSTSQWCSPTFVVPKKTGDWRVVFDYRKVNALSKKLKYPIPDINYQWYKFRNKEYITTLDVKSGYWHVRIHEEDKHKLAFIFDGHLYEWNVMPFGPTNAPSYFQYVMNMVFQDLDFVIVYIDDITIISDTWEEHQKHLKLVMDRINYYNIKLRLDKCAWCMQEVQYLGFIADKYGSKVCWCWYCWRS